LPIFFSVLWQTFLSLSGFRSFQRNSIFPDAVSNILVIKLDLTLIKICKILCQCKYQRAESIKQEPGLSSESLPFFPVVPRIILTVAVLPSTL